MAKDAIASEVIEKGLIFSGWLLLFVSKFFIKILAKYYYKIRKNFIKINKNNGATTATALSLFFRSAFFKLTSNGNPSDDKICSLLIIKKGSYK